MVPTPADIARYRHVAAAVVRGVGLLLLLYAATRVGTFIWTNLDDLSSAMGRGGVQRWNLERLVSSVSLQAVLLVFAIIAIGWPRWIARWLVPARVRAACPGCGFNLSGLRSETCPECGLILGTEFLPDNTRPDEKAEGLDSE